MRRIDLGAILAGAGALLLLVALFLDWYENDANAWTNFEVLDLVLAACALLVVAGAAARLGASGARRARRTMLPGAIAALVVVLSQLVNHPPAATDVGNDVGIYLALGGAVLMAIGALLGVARISLALDVDRQDGAPPDAPTAVSEPL
jgi:hypothetical protein